MRSLPPVPEDVVWFGLGFDCDGATSSIGFWLEVPGINVAVPTDITALLGQLIFAALDFKGPITHAGCQLTTCRLRNTGTAPFDLIEVPSTNHGAWTGGQANQVASGLHWQTTVHARRGQSITHVPGFPDAFTDDHVVLNATGWSNLSSAAGGFLSAVNAAHAGGLASVRLGTLYRSRGGVPLGSSEFAPFFFVVPSRVITTIRRRMSQGRSRSLST